MGFQLSITLNIQSLDQSDRQGLSQRVQRRIWRLPWVRSHSSWVFDMPVAPRATADQRQGWETGQTPHEDTAMPSQHARCLTPLSQPIKAWPPGYAGETAGGKMLRKPLPSCPAHHQPRGSSSALTSSVMWLSGRARDRNQI